MPLESSTRQRAGHPPQSEDASRWSPVRSRAVLSSSSTREELEFLTWAKRNLYRRWSPRKEMGCLHFLALALAAGLGKGIPLTCSIPCNSPDMFETLGGLKRPVMTVAADNVNTGLQSGYDKANIDLYAIRFLLTEYPAALLHSDKNV